MKQINCTIIILALIYCTALHTVSDVDNGTDAFYYKNIGAAEYTMPALVDMDSVMNKAKHSVAGYSHNAKSVHEFDKGNGASCSPEYIAYILKHLPIADGKTSIVRLKGGTPQSSDNFSFVVASYTNSGEQIRGAFLCAVQGNSFGYNPAKNLTLARVVACMQNYKNGNPDDPVKPLIACDRGEGFKAFSKHASETHFKGPHAKYWGYWDTVQSSQQDLNQFLSQQLSKLAHSYFSLARIVASQLITNNANKTSNALSYYSALKSQVFKDTEFAKDADGKSLYSIAPLGHYNWLVNGLLTGQGMSAFYYKHKYSSFPTSDTSDVMFNVAPCNFSNHPIYLLFAANKFSRNWNIHFSPAVNSLIGIAILAHRFKELKDRMSNQLWQENPNIADIYESIAIMHAFLPRFNDGQGNSLPDLTQWDNANDAATAVEKLSSGQLNAISLASSTIDNSISQFASEIAALHSISLCPNGQIYTGQCPNQSLPLINFIQNGVDRQLFNWGAYPLQKK